MFEIIYFGGIVFIIFVMCFLNFFGLKMSIDRDDSLGIIFLVIIWPIVAVVSLIGLAFVIAFVVLWICVGLLAHAISSLFGLKRLPNIFSFNKKNEEET